MKVPGLLVYLGGLILVAIAVWVLFFEAGLDEWIPAGFAGFVVLLILGLGLLASVDRFREDEEAAR